MKTKPAGDFDLKALVLHPNPINRQYLWQAILADIHFDTVKAIKNVDELLDHLEYSAPYDTVLVSTEIEWSDRERLIKNARETKGGELAAYILVVSGESKDTANLAAEMTGDYNGLLLEPYSADNLRVVAETAKKVTGEALQRRKKIGMQTQIKEVVKYLDLTALDVYMEDDHRKHMRDFKEVCKPLKKSATKSKELYLETLTELCADAKPRTAEKIDVGDMYSGTSSRVKKKLKEKLKNQQEQPKPS